MIQALWFDMDNTLIDWHEAQRLYCADFVANHYPDLSGEARQERIRQVIALGGDGNNVGLDEFFHAIHSRWGLSDDRESLYRERTHLFCACHTIPLPGLHETLALLKKSYRLGLLSNGAAHSQRVKIEVAGLYPYFEHTVISGETPYSKPDRRLFEHCLDLMGLSPDRAVYIGDHVRNDVEGSIGAGMRAVRMRVPGHPAISIPGVPEIDRLDQLPGVLKALEG